MKKISIMFVAALSLAAVGCKKKGADCDKAINNSMELSKAEMSKRLGVDDKMMAKMKDIGIKHCTEDKWSDDTVKCMSDAKTEAEAQTCYSKMPADQRDKMQTEVMAMMTPPGTGSAAMGSGSAGAMGSGSAMGSDGSAGSAMAGSGSATMAGSGSAK